jgi:hypothetical protein
MAKLEFKEKDEAKKEESIEPTIHFTEAEVKEVVEFTNFFAKNHKYTGNILEFEEYKKLFINMNTHIKKIETYIFEIKKVVKSKKE